MRDLRCYGITLGEHDFPTVDDGNEPSGVFDLRVAQPPVTALLPLTRHFD